MGAPQDQLLVAGRVSAHEDSFPGTLGVSGIRSAAAAANAVHSPDSWIGRYVDLGIWRDRTPLDDLAQWAAETPDATAVSAWREGAPVHHVTYRQQEVDRYARVLHARGIGDGDVVALWLPNRFEVLALLLACWKVGAITAPISPTVGRREVGRILDRLDAAVCVTSEDLATGLPALRLQLSLADFEQDAPDVRFAGVNPDQARIVLFTSGTTGEPKGAAHTLNTAITQAIDGGALEQIADHNDGWYDTGDLAVPDGRGGLTIVGRVADRISSGFMIPVTDVEEALRAHPLVKEAALIGVPGLDGQEIVCAVVVPADPGRQPGLDELRQFLLADGMTPWYLPERLSLTEALPRNALGKVQKALLRRQEASTGADLKARSSRCWPSKLDCTRMPSRPTGVSGPQPDEFVFELGECERCALGRIESQGVRRVARLPPHRPGLGTAAGNRASVGAKIHAVHGNTLPHRLGGLRPQQQCGAIRTVERLAPARFAGRPHRADGRPRAIRPESGQVPLEVGRMRAQAHRIQ
ncbi:class I adenylate-forming enzyme family protein [Actinoplanes sp. NPDC051470]|uniref:class I adenylate-forming enzyme family protein n=1 Tax=Actinoplanes sp. NPDC051470 TaxID=3157224 RepID=UPI003412DB67